MKPAPKKLHHLLGILRFLTNYPVQFCLSLGLLLINISIELYLPQILGNSINGLRTAGPRFNYWPFVYLFGSLVLIRAGVGYILGPIRNQLMQSALADVRRALFDAIQRLGFRYHDKAGTGDLISRSTTDVGRLQDFFVACMLLTVDIVVSVVIILVIIFWIHPWLGWLSLLTIIPAIALIAFFSRQLQPRWRKVHDLQGKMTTTIQENIAGVRVVKAFGKENAEVEKFRTQRDRYLQEYLATIHYWAARVPLAQFVFGLSAPAILWAGGYLIIHSSLSLGDLAKVLFYLLSLGSRMGMVGQFASILQNASASAERINEVLQATDRIPDGTKLANPGDGEVVFEGVSFNYSDNPLTLKDVSFTAAPRHTMAIVGPTGAGKSTLVHLIPRFYLPTSGRILIDGLDIREMKLDALRRSIGVIFQETVLFNATVQENIAYGCPGASLDKVKECASAAQADEFISQLPEGYQTVLGERGVTLSGGQKQRLAIARAFLLDPKILIFDDATASVDSRTEIEIQKAMKLLCQNRTTFVIAHRLSSIQLADQILLLNHGELVACGPTDQVKSHPQFRDLFANPALQTTGIDST